MAAYVAERQHGLLTGYRRGGEAETSVPGAILPRISVAERLHITLSVRRMGEMKMTGKCSRSATELDGRFSFLAQ